MTTEFPQLVLRVGDTRASRGDLDADFLDAAGVVLGTSGLRRLVALLHARQALPGLLAGLVEGLDVSDGPRRLAAAVAALSDRDQSRAAAVQLERARRHLDLLAALSPARPVDVEAEVDQLVEDLLAGRELP